MKLIVFALLLALFATPVNAESFSATDSRGGKVTLSNKSCSIGGWFKEWKAGKWFYEGKDYEICWTVQQNVVVVIDSVGIMSAIPMAYFKPDQGV